MTRLMLEIPKLNRLKEQSMREMLADCESREEICFETGIYDNDCDCWICIHKDECSGYEGD